MSEQNGEKLAMRVSRNTIIGNLLLSAVKMAAGIFGRSASMISDAVHSCSDVISTVIVMAGIRFAGKSADRGHPYGHERFECIAAIILAGILCLTGAGIGYHGIQVIAGEQNGSIPTPHGIALAAALLSIFAKEAMYWYTRKAAKKAESDALMADAWHHRSDALSSVGSLVGIAGARLGVPVLDPIASLLICVFIIKAGIDIFRDAVHKVTDSACDDATLSQISTLILEQREVLGIDLLQTRLFGSKIYVDLEISVDSSATLEESHQIAHRVHDIIEQEFRKVKHCMVHVNPAQVQEASDMADEPSFGWGTDECEWL